jgi:hypothetical protein
LAVTVVPDILSQGGGREPGPWPRRLVVAAAVLALMAVAIVHYLPRAGKGSASPAASPTATPPPPPLADSTAVSGDGATALEPDGITGPVLSWPGGLRLLASGQQPAWYWPATGQQQTIGGLPPRGAGYQVIRVAGGWAVQPLPVAPTVCNACAGSLRPVYFLADAGRSVTLVGRADAVAPSADGSLWLTSLPPDAAPGRGAATAREVSVAGRPLGPVISLPAGYRIVQGTSRGLLLAPTSLASGTATDKLWDPAARRSGRSFANVIAASTTQIAWAPPCTVRCRVQVVDLTGGRQLTTELPAASSVANASFSPDGKFLALELSFGDNDNDGQLAVQLESVSMASGRLTVVPQTWASSDALVGFGWPASGDSLVAELNFTTKTQLASWRPGASRLAIAALGPAHRPAPLAIGQYSPIP